MLNFFFSFFFNYFKTRSRYIDLVVNSEGNDTHENGFKHIVLLRFSMCFYHSIIMSKFMGPFLILNKTVQYSWVITTKWSASYQVVSRLQEVLNALLVNWSHWLSWSVGHFIAICEQGEQLCAVKDHFLPPGPQPVEPHWRKCWKSKCKYFWSIMDLGAFHILHT